MLHLNPHICEEKSTPKGVQTKNVKHVKCKQKFTPFIVILALTNING
jgi:hypothetical protein